MNEENKKTNETKDYDGPNVFQSIFRTYKAEFKKIVWPSRQTLTKHTITVAVVSLIFGAYIALADGVFGAIFSRFVQFVLG